MTRFAIVPMLALALALVACSALDADGPAPCTTCEPEPPPPEPEICDQTDCVDIPNTMRFLGEDQRLAVGGEMTITAQKCFFFCGDFAVDFNVFTTDNIEVVSVVGADITLRALEDGQAIIVLRRPEDGATFGSTDVIMRPVVRVELEHASRVYSSAVSHGIDVVAYDRSNQPLVGDVLRFDLEGIGGGSGVVGPREFFTGLVPAGDRVVAVYDGDSPFAVSQLALSFADAPDAISLIADGTTVAAGDVAFFGLSPTFDGRPYRDAARTLLAPEVVVTETEVAAIFVGNFYFRSLVIGDAPISIDIDGTVLDFVITVTEPAP